MNPNKTTDVILMYICIVFIYTVVNHGYGGDWLIDLVFACYSILTVQALIEIKITKTRVSEEEK